MSIISNSLTAADIVSNSNSVTVAYIGSNSNSVTAADIVSSSNSVTAKDICSNSNSVTAKDIDSNSNCVTAKIIGSNSKSGAVADTSSNSNSETAADGQQQQWLTVADTGINRYDMPCRGRYKQAHQQCDISIYQQQPQRNAPATVTGTAASAFKEGKVPAAVNYIIFDVRSGGAILGGF
jgi:hypothetical protein